MLPLIATVICDQCKLNHLEAERIEHEEKTGCPSCGSFYSHVSDLQINKNYVLKNIR